MISTPSPHTNSKARGALARLARLGQLEFVGDNRSVTTSLSVPNNDPLQITCTHVLCCSPRHHRSDSDHDTDTAMMDITSAATVSFCLCLGVTGVLTSSEAYTHTHGSPYRMKRDRVPVQHDRAVATTTVSGRVVPVALDGVANRGGKSSAVALSAALSSACFSAAASSAAFNAFTFSASISGAIRRRHIQRRRHTSLTLHPHASPLHTSASPRDGHTRPVVQRRVLPFCDTLS